MLESSRCKGRLNRAGLDSAKASSFGIERQNGGKTWALPELEGARRLGSVKGDITQSCQIMTDYHQHRRSTLS